MPILGFVFVVTATRILFMTRRVASAANELEFERDESLIKPDYDVTQPGGITLSTSQDIHKESHAVKCLKDIHLKTGKLSVPTTKLPYISRSSRFARADWISIGSIALGSL
jgi:hypothetical protein